MLDSGIKFDDLHYTTSAIDSYGKPFNFIISEREAGKTTALVASKMYKAFKEKGRPALVLRNQGVDISEAYIHSFEETTNKFAGRELKLSFRRGDVNKGICLVWDESTGEKKLYAAIAALSVPMARLKSINIGKVSLILYDEAIVATSMGERYPDNLAFKIKELYRTFARESRPEVLRLFCLANPYSRFHPLLTDWGVPFQDMKRGSIITGPNWAVECYEMKPELRKFIIEHDPTYQFDDAYRRYAFDGASIEDEQYSAKAARGILHPLRVQSQQPLSLRVARSRIHGRGFPVRVQVLDAGHGGAAWEAPAAHVRGLHAIVRERLIAQGIPRLLRKSEDGRGSKPSPVRRSRGVLSDASRVRGSIKNLLFDPYF